MTSECSRYSTRSQGNEGLLTLTLDEVRRLEYSRRKPQKKKMVEINPEEHRKLLEQAEEITRIREELAQLRKEAIPEKKVTIGEADTPHTFYSDRSPVIVPPADVDNFTVGPQLITLVRQNRFHGVPAENPTDHIDGFEAICETLKQSGLSKDYLPCLLFKFSLADKAERWWKSLPAGSLKTWDETRAAFLDNFYTKAKTQSLRSKISGFQQATSESFGDAWDRYKGYTRDCPHHGYSESHLLSFFYEGVHWEFKSMLNSSSGGDFMRQTHEDAIGVIEKIAVSMSPKPTDKERGVKVHSIEAQRIEDLNTKLDILLKKERSVHFAKTDDEIDDDEVAVNFVGNYNQQYQGQQNQGRPWTNTWKPAQPTMQPATKRTWGNDAYQTPQPNVGVRQLLETLLEGQEKLIGTFNGKIDHVYGEFQQKFETISSHLKKLDTQVAQTAESVRRQEGFLPGKTDSNPRAQINMLFSLSYAKNALAGGVSTDALLTVDRHRVLPNLSHALTSLENTIGRSTLKPNQDQTREGRRDNKLMFYISCIESGSGKLLPNCLCDTGASINVMSWNTAQHLNLVIDAPIIPHAEIANGALVNSLGYIPNVYLVVKGKLIGVNFHIFNMTDDRMGQIILGTDFLEAVGAVLDFSTHKISYTRLDDKRDYKHPAAEEC